MPINEQPAGQVASDHAFVDPSKVAKLAISLVRGDLIHAATMNRDFQAEFGGGSGSTVDVEVPAVLGPARERELHATTSIVMDTLTSSVLPVVIDTHVYSAVRIDDADMTLNIADFGRQVLQPQTIAMVENLENRAVALMKTAPAYHATDFPLIPEWVADEPLDTFTAARKYLRDMRLPAAGLFAACGTEVYADLLNMGALTDVSQAGSSDALRNAVAGKVRGFLTYESNRLGEKEVIFYNRASFTLAIRAPKVPKGAAYGHSAAANGFALRWLADYDADTLADRSIVSTFVGGRSIPVQGIGKDGQATGLTVPALKIVKP